MGIGMTLICSPENVGHVLEKLPDGKVIGEVVKQTGETRVTISES
jgi:hypothetical protein